LDKLRALETFVAVAEGGGFATAARKLNVSAPSVTRLVSDLEAHLGVMLLQRTTRQVTLTDIGAQYLEDAKAVLADLQCADDAAQGAHGTPTGRIRVTASSMFGQIYITPIIADYLGRHAEVGVDAIFVDRVVNMIDEGIDVSVRIGELQDSSLMATRVGSVQLQVCGSPDYFKTHAIPQVPGDLLSHEMIGLPLGNFQGGWKFANDEIIKPEHRLTFNSIPAAIEAAKSGWGLLRAISYQIGPDLERGTLQSVLQDHAPEPIPIHVIHGQGRRASAKVRTFVDLAVETLRANPFLN